MLTETEDQRLQKLQVMIHALAAPAARAKVGITDERYTELVGYFDGRVRASHVAAVAETEAEARHSDIHEVANHDKWHSTSTAFEHEGRQYRGTRVYDNLNVELSDGDHLVRGRSRKVSAAERAGILARITELVSPEHLAAAKSHGRGRPNRDVAESIAAVGTAVDTLVSEGYTQAAISQALNTTEVRISRWRTTN
jgi:hypothetical protein